MKNIKRINLIKTLVALTPLCLTSCLMGNSIHFQKQVHEINFHNTFFNANAKEKVSLLELTNVLHKNFTKEIQSNFQKRINYYKNYRAKAYALSVENLFSKGSLIGETQSKIFNNPNADQKIISNNLKITYAIKNFTDYRIIDGQLILGSTYKNQKLNLRITCTAKNGAGVTTDLNNVYGLGLNNQEYNNRYYEHFVNVLNSFQWPNFTLPAPLNPLQPNTEFINFADAFQKLIKEVKQTASADNLNPQLYTDYNFSIQNVFIKNQTSNPVTSDNNSYKGLVLKLSNNYQNSVITFAVNTGSSAGTKYFSKTFTSGAEKIANVDGSGMVTSTKNSITFLNDLSYSFQGIQYPTKNPDQGTTDSYAQAPDLKINLIAKTYFLNSGKIITNALSDQVFWDPNSSVPWKLNNNLSNLMGSSWSNSGSTGTLMDASQGNVIGKINKFDVNKNSLKSKYYQTEAGNEGVFLNITGIFNLNYGSFSGGWYEHYVMGQTYWQYETNSVPDQHQNYSLYWNLSFSTWSDFSANDQEANLTFNQNKITNSLVNSQYMSTDNQIVSTVDPKTIAWKDYENFGKSYGRIKATNYTLNKEATADLSLETYDDKSFINSINGNLLQLKTKSHKLLWTQLYAVATQSAFLSEKIQKASKNPSQIKNYSFSDKGYLENTSNKNIKIPQSFQSVLNVIEANGIPKLVGNALSCSYSSGGAPKDPATEMDIDFINLNPSNTEVTNVNYVFLCYDSNLVNCHLTYDPSDNSYAIVGTEKTAKSNMIFQYHWFNFSNT